MLAHLISEANTGLIKTLSIVLQCNFKWNGRGIGEFIIIIIMLLSKVTYNKYICQKKEKQYIAVEYSKDVHRTKSKALTIASLTHFLCTTKIARIRRYTMLSTIFKHEDVQRTISLYIKCREVQLQ